MTNILLLKQMPETGHIWRIGGLQVGVLEVECLYGKGAGSDRGPKCTPANKQET